MYDLTSLNTLNPNSLNFGAGGNSLAVNPNAFSFGSPSTMAPSATQGFNLGLNIPPLQMGMQGLNTLGNLRGAWQANNLAKDQLDFTKNITNANLNNSIKSYNTALEDRARARGFTEGQSSGEVQSYIDNNRLSR